MITLKDLETAKRYFTLHEDGIMGMYKVISEKVEKDYGINCSARTVGEVFRDERGKVDEAVKAGKMTFLNKRYRKIIYVGIREGKKLRNEHRLPREQKINWK